MDKQALVMFSQIMSALSHMPTLDKGHEKEIMEEIERIKAGRAPKKGTAPVVDAEKLVKD